MRVFIAIDITREAKREIKKFLKFLQKKHWPVKWEKPEKIHLTLVFLGSVEKDKLQLIKSACQKASQNVQPFELAFKGLGCFPKYDWPRLIWLGFKGDLKSLAKLQKEIEKNLVNLDFQFDSKPFSPHLTLGRIKKARPRQRKEIGRQIKKLRILDLKSKVLINKVVIYQSTCLASGSVYQQLEEIWIK